MMSTGAKAHVPVMWHSEGGNNSVGMVGNDASNIDHGVSQAPWERGWSPYDFNGGTGVAIAGDDYAVIAADTRMSTGADVDTLWKALDGDVILYKYDIGREMTTTSLSQMLANRLYYRRFFPYYAFNVLAGLDAEGRGVVYSYDAIGSFQSVPYNAIGSGALYLMPLLDNLVGFKTRNDPKPNRTASETVELVKDAFVAAGERDIYTGDTLEIMVIGADGVKVENFQLKKD